MNRSLLALTFCISTCASAQLFEIGAGGGVHKLSSNDIGTLSDGVGGTVPVTLDDGWRFGFRFGFNNLNFLGHEVSYAYNRSKLLVDGVDQGGMAIHQGGYNFLVYGTREGTVIRPFVTGGGGFENFVPPGASATQGQGDTKFGFNYGGGIKVRVAPNWGFRLDYRQYNTGKPFDLPGVSGRLKMTEISAGFMFMM